MLPIVSQRKNPHHWCPDRPCSGRKSSPTRRAASPASTVPPKRHEHRAARASRSEISKKSMASPSVSPASPSARKAMSSKATLIGEFSTRIARRSSKACARFRAAREASAVVRAEALPSTAQCVRRASSGGVVLPGSNAQRFEGQQGVCVPSLFSSEKTRRGTPTSFSITLPGGKNRTKRLPLDRALEAANHCASALSGPAGQQSGETSPEGGLHAAAVAALSLFGFPIAAHAQSGAAAGATTGAVGGAIVGGPVGAVVGGVGGAIIGGLSDDQRPRFREYSVRERRPSYRYQEEVRVGAVLPSSGVTYYRCLPNTAFATTATRW